MTTHQRCPECGAPLPDNAPQGLCPACLLQGGLATSPSAAGARGDAATEDSPATRFLPPKPAQLAPLFPQLEVLELVGHGGMGAVYKARQKGLDRVVALKILPPEVGRDPKFADRFTREAKALARLNHPHIVTVHDVGKAGDYYYFLMEYVDGLNLREALRAGRLSPPEAMAIVPQICDALQYAHDEGIVHRDIKPENILLDKKGRVKIADFGLAKLLGRRIDDLSLTQDRQVMGTPRYMAPEQMQGAAAVDHRADIYSLGVVFYEMLTGEVPMGRFAAPSQKVQVDVRLDEVVLRALDAEPQRRYQQVSEVKSQVETIASSPRQPAAAVPAAPRKSVAPSVAVVVIVLSAAMCAVPALLICAGVYLWLGFVPHAETREATRAPTQPLPTKEVPADRPTTPAPMRHDDHLNYRSAGEAVNTGRMTRHVVRELEFCLVPEVGESPDQPHLQQPEFDRLAGQLRDDGPQSLEKDAPWRWLELAEGVAADDLPIGARGEQRYLLVANRQEEILRTLPEAVEPVVSSETHEVAFVLDEEAGRRLASLTAGHLGGRLAIAVGGGVVSAPVIRSAIGRQGRITGNFTAAEAQAIVEQLTSHDSPTRE